MFDVNAFSSMNEQVHQVNLIDISTAPSKDPPPMADPFEFVFETGRETLLKSPDAHDLIRLLQLLKLSRSSWDPDPLKNFTEE